MDEDKKRAEETLLRLAEMKAKKKLAPVVEKKAKTTLKDIGVQPEVAARTAATLGALHQLSQGDMAFDIGDFSIGAKMTPEERAIRFGYKKGF